MNKLYFAPHHKKGFTIIELLVVIAVIAILAAVTIVGYGVWRKTTLQNAVKSDLISMSAAMESARTFGNAYPLSIPPAFTPSSGVNIVFDTSSTVKAYCVNGNSIEDTSIAYYIDSVTRDAGAQSGTCAERPVPPTVPTGLAAGGTTDSTTALTWTLTSGATSYNVQCDTSSSYASPLTNSSTTASKTMGGLTASALYYCRIQAANAYGMSPWSSSVTTTTTALSPPTGLATTTTTGTTLRVTWSANSNATDYTIQCATNAGFTTGLLSQSISSPTVTATFTGLTFSTPYYCRVNSINATNTSLWSSTLTTATSNTYGALAAGTSIEGYWTTAPAGFLLEDGAAVSRTTYADLFAAIGTTYGAGNGSTTFNLPDSRGRAAVNISSADAEFNTMGEETGTKTETLTIAQMPSHTHIQNAHNHNGGFSGLNANSAFGVATGGSGNSNGQNGTNTNYHAITSSTTAVNQSTGGDDPHNNIQPSIAKNFAIKFTPIETAAITPAAGSSIDGYWASAPSGYLLEDGSAVSRTTYADLFAVIGTTYGAGNGSTTFNLPDSRGRVAVNKNSSDAEFDTVGEKYGEKAHTVTISELPSHTHIQNAHNHIEGFAGINASGAYGVTSLGVAGNMTDQYGMSTANHALTSPTTAVNQPTGGGGSHNEIQPSTVKRSAIKYSVSSGTTTNIATGSSLKGYWTGAPGDYLIEDGTAVSRTTYADLFAVIGTTYGAGNGSTTFNLPDSRGRVAVGKNPSDAEFDTLGEKYGTKTETLTIAQMPSHTHIQNAHSHIDGYSGVNGNGAFGATSTAVAGNINNQVQGTTTNFPYTSSTTAVNQSTGGSGAHNNIQPSIVKLTVIKI